MIRLLKYLLGLDMGDWIAPYPDDSPAKRALREKIERKLHER